MLIQTHPYLGLPSGLTTFDSLGMEPRAQIDVLNAPGISDVHLQEEPHWYVGRMKDELASGSIDSPFADSGFCLQTQGLGPTLKMFMLLLWNILGAPQVPKEKYLQVNLGQGKPAGSHFLENTTPWQEREERRGQDGTGSGEDSMPGATFEAWVLSDALHLNTFSPFILKRYLFHSQLRPCVSDLLTLNSSSKCFLMLKFVSTLGSFFPL